MHERKARMAQLADGFLALPGGAGTLEELFEIWTWAQLGLHDKPIGLVDVEGYYQPLLTMTEHMVDAGFLRPVYRDMIAVDADPAALLDGFATYRAPETKWAAATTEEVKPVEEPIDVLAWIVVRDGKLLNVRTRGKAHFYLPGGKREPGESDPAGLTREIAEELGVRIDPASMRLFDLVQDKADGWADGTTRPDGLLLGRPRGRTGARPRNRRTRLDRPRRRAQTRPRRPAGAAHAGRTGADQLTQAALGRLW